MIAMVGSDPTARRDDEPIREVIRRAWITGKSIDLDGIGYGKAHWGDFNAIVTDPLPYYFLLAGLARTTGATRICDVGTHWGGSARALRRGAIGDAPVVVTIDISRRSDKPLAGETCIHKIVGDASSDSVVDAAAKRLAAPQGIDILFLDSHHTFDATWTQFQKYTGWLRPRFVVLDDIELNDEMARAWRTVRETVSADDAIEAKDVDPGIRDTGLGIVRLRRPTPPAQTA